MDDDPDTDIDLGIELAPWSELTPDERLRCFIFKHYCSGTPEAIDGHIFVTNLQSIFDWMKNGKVPAKRSGLKVVGKTDGSP